MKVKHFTEEHHAFRQSLRAFLDKEVVPFVDEWEEKGQIPKSIWKKMGDQGYLGLNYPEQYGGLDLDFYYSLIFCEEVSKCWSGGFTISALVIQYMSSPYIFKHGSEFLKEKYLSKIIAGELVSCIGITEPGAGSDVQNIRTTAKLEGDHYVVNGSKTFITNGYYGDLLVAVVKTNPDAGAHGVSLLLIDLNSAGVSKRKIKKLGWHSSDTAELAFDNVKVPKENLLGEEGMGFMYLMGGLQLERLTGAVMGTAGSEQALGYAMQYMNEREAFGRKINKFQVLRHRVAQMIADIETVKAYVYYCCDLHNQGIYAVKECSIAKLQSSELALGIMDKSLQFFGGYGFTEEYKIARFYRDARVGTIGGGSSEIMREIIAKMTFDEIEYETAYKANTSANKPKTESKKTEELFNNNKKTETTMNLVELISAGAAKVPAIGKTLKLDLGDQIIYLDGNNNNAVSTEDKDADCTIIVSLEDLTKLYKGELNAMAAVMTGKIKIKGDMGVAMKLQSLFK